MNALMRNDYYKLSQEERRILLQRIGEKFQFHLKSLREFSRFGQTNSTAVYEDESGSEFVFVSGDEVTLGWDHFVYGMDAETRKEIEEFMREFEIATSVEEFLNEGTTPVRKTTISPMLVERKLQGIGWEKVSFQSSAVLENYKDAYKEFIRHEDCSCYTVRKAVKFTRENGENSAYLYSGISFEELSQKLAQRGYSLPNQDEWEYLCGGGCKSLFVWGDSFDFSLHLRHFMDRNEKEPIYDLEKPNMFGIQIAYDPYRMEVITNQGRPDFKGGDGGCNVCGGAGAVLGYFPCSPYYACQEESDAFYDNQGYELDEDFYYFRRIIRISPLLVI